MQKISCLILILAFLGQTFNQGFYHLGYLLNKADYEKRCVNKARPAMHCNGKCQLMKKIAEQEKKERGNAPELKLAKNEVLSSRSSFVMGVGNLPVASRLVFHVFSIGRPVDRASEFFHPPSIRG